MSRHRRRRSYRARKREPEQVEPCDCDQCLAIYEVMSIRVTAAMAEAYKKGFASVSSWEPHVWGRLPGGRP